jgi:hypothetical protein
MGKKRRRGEKNIGYSPGLIRTREERAIEVHKIMSTLTEFGLTTTYEPVKKLLPLLSQYVEEGVRINIDIPIDEIKRRIIGVLATSKREEVCVRLEKMD